MFLYLRIASLLVAMTSMFSPAVSPQSTLPGHEASVQPPDAVAPGLRPDQLLLVQALSPEGGLGCPGSYGLERLTRAIIGAEPFHPFRTNARVLTEGRLFTSQTTGTLLSGPWLRDPIKYFESEMLIERPVSEQKAVIQILAICVAPDGRRLAEGAFPDSILHYAGIFLGHELELTRRHCLAWPLMNFVFANQHHGTQKMHFRSW
jgi:hypothetical protein